MNGMRVLKLGAKAGVLATLIVTAGVPLYALPATLSLPCGRRPGIEPLTIHQAACRLQTSGKKGWDLIEASRSLVADRMSYSRRNSFDPAPKAFSRGYGYCQQMSFALTALLCKMGFEAKVVQAFRNRFPDGRVGGHAWVTVTYQGETRHIDACLWDEESSRPDFTPLSKVTEVGPIFRVVAGWGSTAVNAYRYYKTGVDY